jgi:O-antigen/teichoic acid export membrane protein
MMEPRSASATSDEHAKQSNLSHQTLSALFWAFSGKSVLIVLRTVTIVVLARLLAPAHFGLVAAALTVVQFSEIFALLGV